MTKGIKPSQLACERQELELSMSAPDSTLRYCGMLGEHWKFHQQIEILWHDIKYKAVFLCHTVIPLCDHLCKKGWPHKRWPLQNGMNQLKVSWGSIIFTEVNPRGMVYTFSGVIPLGSGSPVCDNEFDSLIVPTFFQEWAHERGSVVFSDSVHQSECSKWCTGHTFEENHWFWKTTLVSVYDCVFV